MVGGDLDDDSKRRRIYVMESLHNYGDVNEHCEQRSFYLIVQAEWLTNIIV